MGIDPRSDTADTTTSTGEETEEGGVTGGCAHDNNINTVLVEIMADADDTNDSRPLSKAGLSCVTTLIETQLSPNKALRTT